MKQITINFEAGLVEAYPSCREYIAARVHQIGRPQKAIAADMDYSPSHLSRKLSQNPDDSMKFTLDDAEKYMDITGDIQPAIYWVEKYLAKASIQEIERQIAVLREKLHEQRLSK